MRTPAPRPRTQRVGDAIAAPSPFIVPSKTGASGPGAGAVVISSRSLRVPGARSFGTQDAHSLTTRSCCERLRRYLPPARRVWTGHRPGPAPVGILAGNAPRLPRCRARRRNGPVVLRPRPPHGRCGPREHLRRPGGEAPGPRRTRGAEGPRGADRRGAPARGAEGPGRTAPPGGGRAALPLRQRRGGGAVPRRRPGAGRLGPRGATPALGGGERPRRRPARPARHREGRLGARRSGRFDRGAHRAGPSPRLGLVPFSRGGPVATRARTVAARARLGTPATGPRG